MRVVRSMMLSAAMLLPASATAQGVADSIEFDGDAERSFVAAMRLFLAEDYDSASTVFLDHLRRFPRSHRTTGAYIMGGKALHESRRYRESIRLLKDLIDLYPTSAYADDAHYTLALDYFSLQRYEDALDQLFSVRESSADTALWRRSEQLLDRLASTNLSLELLADGISRAPDVVVRVLFSLRLAERVQRTGDIRRAVSILDAVAGVPATVRYVPEVQALLTDLERGRTLKIGAVLPLNLRSTRSGSRDLGVEFLEGMRLAIDLFNATSVSKVQLDALDSELDAAVAARAVTDLVSDEEVVAILGPISSNEAFVAAGIAQASGVPIITPTATANGIGAIGSGVFQANPDYHVRGKAMAAYARQTLGASVFAVLAPADAVGKLMADGFIDDVKKHGDDLVSVQWYYAGSTDLRSQIQEIRTLALRRKVIPYIDFAVPMRHRLILDMVIAGGDQRAIDSLVEVGGAMSLDSLLGRGSAALADSLGLPVRFREVNIDSLGIAVDNIDAIFVPIATSEEIAVVSSQLKYFNFTSTILGTGDWHDLGELDRNRRYTNGVLFSVDIYTQADDSAMIAFTREYRKRVNRAPSANAVMGYDVASLVLSVIRKGATVRSEIAEGLSQVRDYIGLRSKVSFTNDRVNGFLWVMEYRDGRVRQIGEIDLTKEPAEEIQDAEPGGEQGLR